MSNFIERLGWVLVHSLWQFALLATVAFVLQRALRRASSSARYLVLLGMLASIVVVAPFVTWGLLPVEAPQPVIAAVEPPVLPKLVALPKVAPAPVAIEVAPLPAPVAPAPIEPVEASPPVASAPLPELPRPTWSERIQEALTPWLATIVWGWSFGVLAFAMRPLLGWLTVRRLRTVGVSPVPEAVQAALAATAQRLGITHAVRVLQSAVVQVPIVAGYFQPVILLPVSIVTGLPASQLEAILAHELAHIRRHDYVVNLVQTLIETVFFYHPAVWWLSHQIRCERENCCDDIAVSIIGNRVDYSRALLALEELRAVLTPLAIGANGGSLLSRVRRLFHREPEPGNLSNGSVALGATLIAGILTLAAIAAAAPSEINGDISPPILVAKLPGGLEIELVGITPNAAPISEGWQADGQPIVNAGDWPRGATFSKDGDRYTQTTDTATKLTPDPLARDLLFECRGAVSPPSWTFLRQSGLTHFQTLNSEAGLRKRLTLSRRDQAAQTTVEMAYTDSPWGPWQRIDKTGKRINTIETFAPDQKLYGEMQIVRLGPSAHQTDQGSPLELVLIEPALSDDYYSGIFNIEVRFVDQNQKVWGTYAQVTPVQDSRRTVTWTTGGPVPLESLSYAEFRLRPYRHFITFENVPLEKAAAGRVAMKQRSLPQPPASDPDPQFTAKAPGGIEVELLRIVRNDLPEDQSWKPDGKPAPGHFDWPSRTHYKVQPDGNGYSSSSEGPGSDRAWDVVYDVRKSGPHAFVSVDVVGEGGVSSSQTLPAIGPRLVTILPKVPESLTAFQLRVGTEPWGAWIQVGADGEILNPEAMSQSPDSPEKLLTVAGAGLDEENLDRSWIKWLALPNGGQYYQMEVRAIDDDGKIFESRYSSTSPREETKYFELPLDRLARFEYRLRPYRHLVTFDHICTDPAKPTEVKVSVEPIVYPGEIASAPVAANPILQMVESAGTHYNGGDVVQAHIGYTPPLHDAWMNWLEKDATASLEKLPAGKYWLIAKHPWTVFPVELPLASSPLKQTPRAGLPPQKLSSNQYSGELVVEIDKAGKEFIRVNVRNMTDEPWSFSELDLTLGAGWGGEESEAHSPLWLTEKLDETSRIEIAARQTGSFRIDWADWVQRGIWDPMSGVQEQDRPTLPEPQAGKIWVRIGGPGFGTLPVAVTHPDKLLADTGSSKTTATLPGGLELELLGVTPFRGAGQDGWTPQGLKFEKAPDWAGGLKLDPLPPGEMGDSANEAYRDFIVRARGFSPEQLALLPFSQKIDSGDSTIGRMQVLTWNQQVQRLRIGIPGEWGPYRVLRIDPNVVPKALVVKMLAEVHEPFRKLYDSIQLRLEASDAREERWGRPLMKSFPPDYRPGDPDPDFEPGSRVRVVWKGVPTNPDLKYATHEAFVIDLERKSHKAIAKTTFIEPEGGQHWEVDIFNVPISQVSHVEYHLRPYQHVVTFNNVALHPGAKCGPNVVVESPLAAADKPPAPLEFRVVATAAVKEPVEYAGQKWFQIAGEVAPDSAGKPVDDKSSLGLPVERLNESHEHMGLLGDTPATSLPWDGTWHVEKCEVQPDPNGEERFIVSVTLDAPGGQALRTLTTSALRQRLAIIVEERILVAPTIQESFGTSFDITGNFTKEQAEELAKSIRRGMAQTVGKSSSTGQSSAGSWGPAKNGVRSRITLLDSKPHVGSAKVRVELLNEGDVPQEFTLDPRKAGKAFVIQTLDGKQVWRAIENLPVTDARNSDKPITIPPGKSVTLLDEFDLGYAFLFEKPAEYRLRFGGDCEFPGVVSEHFPESNTLKVDLPDGPRSEIQRIGLLLKFDHHISEVNGFHWGGAWAVDDHTFVFRRLDYVNVYQVTLQFTDSVEPAPLYVPEYPKDAPTPKARDVLLGKTKLGYAHLQIPELAEKEWPKCEEQIRERLGEELVAVDALGANGQPPSPPDQILAKVQAEPFTIEPVNGRVLLPNGQPAVGVPVVLRRTQWGRHQFASQADLSTDDPHDLARTVTDTQGGFAFRDVPVPDSYRNQVEVRVDVVARQDGHSVAWSRVIVGMPVTLTLQPEVALAGRVSRPTGEPVAGAVIQAAWMMSLRHITQADLEEGRWPSWKDRSFVGLIDCQLAPTAKSNENGEFVLSGLPRGLGVRLFVRSEEFEPQWFDAATGPITGENLRLTKRPVASGPLTIRMTTPRERLAIRIVDDATGVPLEGAKVVARPSGRLPVSQTGNEHVFRLAAGDVSISAELPLERGYLRGWGVFDAGQTHSAEIRLQRGIPLRGRVIDLETKEPQAGIEVRVDGRLEEIQIGNASLWSKTGSDGSFDLLLAPGKHVVWVPAFQTRYRDVGVSMLDGQFAVKAHQSATIDTSQLPDKLELALERAEGIEGVVLDPQGELAAGVHFRGLYKTDYGAQSIGDVTTEQGEFIISQLFAKDPIARAVPLDVLFWDEQRGLVGSLRVDPVVPSVAHEVQLTPMGRLSGRVVDDQGKPVAHALVQCGIELPSFGRQTGAVIARPVRTGADGRFEILSGVAGYTFDIDVERPGYVRDWKEFSLAANERDKELGDIVLEIEQPVRKLTVELPPLQGLTPEAQYTALSRSFDALVQRVEATRKVARNYDVVPDNTSRLYAQAMWNVAQSPDVGETEWKALLWMVRMRRLTGNNGAEYEKLMQQAGARLIEAYADRPEIAAEADSVAWTQYGIPEGTHRAALVFLEKSPDRTARGVCCLLAAESLLDWGSAASKPIKPETITRVEPLLQRVVSEFADLPHDSDWRSGTIGDCARGWLETLKQVQQGVAVLDMVWKDTQGQPLRISDFKGKVVVLDVGTLGDDGYSRTLLNQAGPDRVMVIQVSHQNVEEAWKALDGLTLPRRQISHEEANRFERMWNIRSWPSAIVLNKRGGVEGYNLREKLPQVLASVLEPKATGVPEVNHHPELP